MLKINKNYSPNFTIPKRSKKKIKFIILHYTGMRNESSVIKRLCDEKSGVSAHYFIKKNGDIINLVPDLYEAWHAGKSCWKNKKSLNKYSIGIEIQNANKRYADIVKTIPSQVSSYIGGSSSETIQTSNESFDLEDAARGTKISTILEASSGDIQDAVNNAKEAQQEWASYTSLDRSRILMNAGQMLKEQTELFAELECLDTARPFNETLYGDIK